MIEIFTLSRKRTSKAYYYIIGMLLFASLLSCEEDKPTITSVSGKIVNPKYSYVVLTNYDNVHDTLQLDEEGIFRKTFDKLDSGLYTIFYPGESQWVFLDQGDSLSIRANTRAFDETIAFTGTHDRENTFLINLFSQIEDSNMDMLKFENKSPRVFYDNVHKVKEERLAKLKEASKKYVFNPRFVEFAEFIIKLNSYYELERYPIIHDSNIYIDKDVNVPEEFFAHRNRVEIDLPKLLNNFAYRPYVNALASNLAYRNLSKRSSKDIDLNNYIYNKERLKVIDSLFENDQLQNVFVAGEIRNFIRGRKNAEEINLLVKDFLAISTDEKINEEIAQMAATYISLDPGNELPDFDLRNMDNERTSLSKQVKKLTVLYYWSIQDKDYALSIHDQVKDLQLKYPEIEFIGINIDQLDFDQWQDIIANNDFRNSREYQLYDKSAINRQLALRNSNRSMVVDRKLTIIDPNINLFYYKIESTLLGYINR
ncbi:TlpA family protein disulfide reductase [Nonlabens marinus]|uniref:Thioredoxin domain-containing protein n=1 Tax=Nonlabens marinus S1-08 TaxID=1454201 RepID=W8VRU8_9FLAO|nr:thioredoxin-like domain-containing protein [Nonlabens marinus]BAO55830.1 hypothetical protein NMS_1821 [Nonlabens marinus S1-08]